MACPLHVKTTSLKKSMFLSHSSSLLLPFGYSSLIVLIMDSEAFGNQFPKFLLKVVLVTAAGEG